MTKAEMLKKGQDPVEFERALWAAWAQNFINSRELDAAMMKCRAEWEAAE